MLTKQQAQALYDALSDRVMNGRTYTGNMVMDVIREFIDNGEHVATMYLEIKNVPHKMTIMEIKDAN